VVVPCNHRSECIDSSNDKKIDTDNTTTSAISTMAVLFSAVRVLSLLPTCPRPDLGLIRISNPLLLQVHPHSSSH